MKSFSTKLLGAVLIISFAILQGACDDDDTVVSSGDVEILSVTPDADKDGTVRAFRGDQITISGNNLSRISHLTLASADESLIIGNENSYGLTEEQMESLIVFDNKSNVLLSFEMPYMDLDMDQGLHKFELVFYKYNSTFTAVEKVYDTDYYVATSNGFEVTDISYADLFPTVGSIATLRGGELNRVKAISVGEVKITSDEFVELNAERTQISFRLPGGNYSQGRNEQDVKVHYDENEVLELDDQIIIYTPKLNTPPAQTTPATLGQILSFTGEYINIIDSVFLDTSKAAIIEDMTNEGVLTVRIPSTLKQQDPPVVTFEIVGYYGDPGQKTVLISGYLVDTTPDENLMPKAETITVEDGGTANERFYLNKMVTVSGKNLAFVEAITVGGLPTGIESRAESQLTFRVPEDFEFTTATEVEIIATYEGTLTSSLGMIKVYPFFYHRDMGLGISSNQGAQAGPDGSNYGMLLLNSGKVISVNEYHDTMFDAGMIKNTAMSATHVIATGGTDLGSINSKSDYYSVEPYFYLSKNSDHKVRMSSPGSGYNSRFIRIYKGGTSYSQMFTTDQKGTPMLTFRNLLTNDPADEVRNGTLETLEYTGTMPTGTDLWGVNAGNALGVSTWEVGNVMVVAYLTYEYGLTGNPGPTLTDAYKIGYMHITRATGMTDAGLANLVDNRISGLVYFDVYWPKNSLRD